MDHEEMEFYSKKVTLVVGGAASGKSAFAERLVRSHGGARAYLATAQALDTEMKEKIARHRVNRGSGWTTIEAPIRVAPVISEVKSGHILLMDCATMWLTNVLLGEHDLAASEAGLFEALDAACGDVVIVSNEVGGGIAPADALSRRFRNVHGHLNQRLAARADLVVTVIAGLPLALKGKLPAAPV
ncbi:MAG: bifunctional adenosylcobinamide kinase/adenosylcobinamide-phosphate guanylyltransferase [Pseudomonadota bacterium]